MTRPVIRFIIVPDNRYVIYSNYDADHHETGSVSFDGTGADLIALLVKADDISCDVVGCTKSSVDCIGGEIWHCAEHNNNAVDLYYERQKERNSK